jgi:hypothetical protein
MVDFRYPSIKKSHMVLITISCLPLFILLFLSYRNMQLMTTLNEQNHKNNTVFCYIDVLTPTNISAIRSLALIGFSLLTICVYLVIWVIIMMNKRKYRELSVSALTVSSRVTPNDTPKCTF